MKFKFPYLQTEFDNVNPFVWRTVLGLSQWSWDRQYPYPDVVVTCIDRSLADQIRLYGEPKFSWHLVRCAVDIRNSHYSPMQLEKVLEFLREGRGGKEWEILSHDSGHGNHIHIGYRDPEWRTRFYDRTVSQEAHQA